MSLVGARIPVAPREARVVLAGLIPRLVSLAAECEVPVRLIGYEVVTPTDEIGERFFGVGLGHEAPGSSAPPPDLADLVAGHALPVGHSRVFARCPIAPPWSWDDDVRLEPPDPTAGERFEAVASMVRDELGSYIARRIEHYGSTAIPGMPAKPIIDVLVEVESLSAAREAVLSAFDRPECECWFWEHLLVIGRERPMGRRLWHLHLATADDPVWRGIAFRDRLRSHPDEAAEYAALKLRLAAEYPQDREMYTVAKEEFVEEILERADALAAHH